MKVFFDSNVLLKYLVAKIGLLMNTYVGSFDGIQDVAYRDIENFLARVI